MDMQPGSVRSSHRAAPQAPFPIILPAEAIAVTLSDYHAGAWRDDPEQRIRPSSARASSGEPTRPSIPWSLIALSSQPIAFV